MMIKSRHLWEEEDHRDVFLYFCDLTPQQNIWGEASGQVMCIFNTSDIDLGQSLGDRQLTFHLYVAW